MLLLTKEDGIITFKFEDKSGGWWPFVVLVDNMYLHLVRRRCIHMLSTSITDAQCHADTDASLIDVSMDKTWAGIRI